NVILCERGVRTFAQHTRNTLDLAAVTAIRRISHLPVIVDPSHGTGTAYMVTPLARAGIAVGADGLMIEVHNQPELALSDSAQALTLSEYAQLIEEVRAIRNLMAPDGDGPLKTACGSRNNGSPNRQLRLLHLQPRAVFRRTRLCCSGQTQR